MSFICRFSLTVAASLAVLPAFAQQTGNWVPANSSPALTGSASAPVTVPIMRYNTGGGIKPVNGNPPPPPPAHGTTFFYSLTGTDKDTWLFVTNPATGTYPSEQRPDDTLQCVAANVEYPMNGPVLRGNAPDGTCTWDVSGFGIVAVDNEVVIAEIRYNTYSIFDNHSEPNEGLVDAPKTVVQTVHIPANTP